MAMTEEARRFIADLVWNDRNFMDAFTANYGFMNSDLAAVYRVPPPAHDFDRVEFPADQERAGLLGQALFLTLTSKLDDTSPTGRRLVRARAVSLPARAAAAAGSGYKPGGGDASAPAHQSRTAGGAHRAIRSAPVAINSSIRSASGWINSMPSECIGRS